MTFYNNISHMRLVTTAFIEHLPVFWDKINYSVEGFYALTMPFYTQKRIKHIFIKEIDNLVNVMPKFCSYQYSLYILILFFIISSSNLKIIIIIAINFIFVKQEDAMNTIALRCIIIHINYIILICILLRIYL